VETREPTSASRYHRQSILPQIGWAGQARLNRARVLIVGCGAIGGVVAEQLARAGVGTIHLADRDIVELTNLQRQVLFDESDAREGLPKAIAAARRLTSINSSIAVAPHVADVDSENIEHLVRDVDLVIDGTDNVETRYLLNDVAVKHAIPWIYGACVGTEGRVMSIRPGQTPCLRCVFPDPPAPGELPTCDTAGVLGPAAAVVGAIEASEALKLFAGDAPTAASMIVIDLWTNRFRSISLAEAKRSDCPVCGLRRFEFLQRDARDGTARLCGRNAVQIRLRRARNGFTLDSVAARLEPLGKVRRNEHLIRASLDDGIELTAFADGRVIVHGTGDITRARSICARYIGA
jgi:adenylyltransferase/sulfurtransferase